MRLTKPKTYSITCTDPNWIAWSYHEALPDLQAEAVASIPYGQATSVFLKVKEPFWDVDGLGSSLWSDGPIGRAYNWATPNEKYIWVFLNGIVNYTLRTWNDDDIMAFVPRELAAIRPSTVGRVEGIAVRNWSNDPYTKGTYATPKGHTPMVRRGK